MLFSLWLASLCTTFYLSIHLATKPPVVSITWLLWKCTHITPIWISFLYLYTQGKGQAGSQSSPVFNYLGSCATVIHKWLYFYQHCTRVLSSLCLYQPFILMIKTTLKDVREPQPWFPSSRSLVMSAVFRYSCWPFAYLLLRNICSDPLSIFQVDCFVFYYIN